MEAGSGVSRDPYNHQQRVVHPAELASRDPSHHSNRGPGVAPPFRAFGSIIERRNGPSGGYESNIPDRFELFLLGEGEKKVVEATDTRTPNSSIFTFNKEDHTLGNLLRGHLHKDPHVQFAGYRVPHPLFATFELRVQTDGEVTPREALVACCKGIVSDLGQLQREFTKEFELRKMVGGEGNPNIEK